MEDDGSADMKISLQPARYVARQHWTNPWNKNVTTIPRMTAKFCEILKGASSLFLCLTVGTMCLGGDRDCSLFRAGLFPT
jgi:hypothetical protein